MPFLELGLVVGKYYLMLLVAREVMNVSFSNLGVNRYTCLTLEVTIFVLKFVLFCWIHCAICAVRLLYDIFQVCLLVKNSLGKLHVV